MNSKRRVIRVDEKTAISSEWLCDNSAASVPAMILAHGAGAGMDHEFLCYFHEALAESGLLSVKFNFPYKEKGRKAPDRGPKLEATYRAVLEAVRRHDPPPTGIFIGGKSMGGRIASYLAAEDAPVDGLFLLGYPLHPPHRPQRLRSDHFGEISCPTLFLQGTRDALCDLQLLGREMERFSAPCELHVVEGGDHSFRVPAKLGKKQEQVRQEVLQALVAWIKLRVRTPRS